MEGKVYVCEGVIHTLKPGRFKEKKLLSNADHNTEHQPSVRLNKDDHIEIQRLSSGHHVKM